MSQQLKTKMVKTVPSYTGTLRSHSLSLPHCVSECGGIRIFGKRVKSLAFTTDVAIVKNINADAIMAVYPFTPQPVIADAIISVADVPVFVGVGGGVTSGMRSYRLAIQAEHQGAFGVVLNAPIPTMWSASSRKMWTSRWWSPWSPRPPISRPDWTPGRTS